MAQSMPDAALPASGPPPGMGGPPAGHSSQSMAAALQQAGLAAGPAPGWPGLQGQQQRPTDQGAALLAHLQNQARTSMGQMRPQDPSGEPLDLCHSACVALVNVVTYNRLLLRQCGWLHDACAAEGKCVMYITSERAWFQSGSAEKIATASCSRSNAALHAPAAAAASATAAAAAATAAGLPWPAASWRPWSAWTAEQRRRCPASGPAAGIPAHAAGAAAEHPSSVFHGQRRYDF